MNTLVKIVYILCSLIFLLYLGLPSQTYPKKIPDALQSQEPADTEDVLKKAYFTNYNREEIMKYYEKNFNKSPFLGIPLPTYRLNYPPEKAFTLIRDQTRSTFLEEITHPFRESFFVNGFTAQQEKDTILIENKIWLYKVTVKLVPSSSVVRIFIGMLTVLIIPFIYKSFLATFENYQRLYILWKRK